MDYDYLNDKQLGSLNNEISILDVNHCSVIESLFTVIKTTDGNNKDFDFSILGEDKTFKGSFKNSNITLSTCDDFSIFYLKNIVENGKTKKEIYSNELQNNAISEVTSTGFGEYKISFNNLAKGESEFFEMVSDKNLEICDIFYGDKQKEAPVICKITRKGDSCEVRMSSKVDYIFMIGLASFFFCKEVYSSDVNSNSYDNMAQISMPTIPSIANKDIPEDRFNKEKYVKLTEDKEPVKKNKSKMAALLGCICCCYCCTQCCCNDEDEARRDRNENSFGVLCDCGLDCLDCDCECTECCGGDSADCCGECAGELLDGCIIM